MKVETGRDDRAPREALTDQLPDVSILNGRIETLERRLKRLSVLAVGLGAVSAGLVGLVVYRTGPSRAVGSSGVVEARRFELTDAVGKRRAVLAVEPNGAASLYLTDAAGRPRATLGVGADGAPALGLGDADGVLRAAVAVGADGQSSVGFFDPRRNLRARFGVSANAVPALDIFDDSQRDRVLLSVEPGRSLLRIADRSGQIRVGLGLASGAPGVFVFDENGTPVGQLP